MVDSALSAQQRSTEEAPTGLFVSLAPNGFHVELPDPVTGQSYPITIPLTLKGLMVLQKILRERERQVGRIGHDSSPVQSMIEKWLLQDRERAVAVPLLEGLDLTSLDLDL